MKHACTLFHTNMKWKERPRVQHKDKPTKLIEITKVFCRSLSFPLFLSPASFCSQLSDSFFSFSCKLSECVSRLSRCCAAVAAGCSMKTGSFVLQFDTWEADSSCWKFKQSERQTQRPPSRQDKHKDSAKTNPTFLSSSSSYSLSLSLSFKARGVSAVPPALLSSSARLPLYSTINFL